LFVDVVNFPLIASCFIQSRNGKLLFQAATLIKIS